MNLFLQAYSIGVLCRTKFSTLNYFSSNLSAPKDWHISHALCGSIIKKTNLIKQTSFDHHDWKSSNNFISKTCSLNTMKDDLIQLLD